MSAMPASHQQQIQQLHQQQQVSVVMNNNNNSNNSSDHPPTNKGTASNNNNTIATLEVLSGGEDHPQNGREARNLAEKHRRDKLNAYIQELSTMVPHVAESTRRLDKTAVLRFAAHGLRLQYVFGKSTVSKHRSNLGGIPGKNDTMPHAPHLTDTLLQLLDSFFVTLTCHGQIVVISGSVEQLLGHCQSDLYGQNILHITHPEDQMLLLQQLIPRDLESLFRPVGSAAAAANPEYYDDGGGGATATDFEADVGDCFQERRPNSPQTQAHLDDIDRRLRRDARCFTVRLARAGTRTESSRTYEIVKIDGCFRRSDYSTTAGSFPIVSQLIRRSRSSHSAATGAAAGGHLFGGPNPLQHDAIAQAALHGISGNDIVLVAMARIIRPPKVLSHRMGEANLLEYKTRHLIDGCIIDCDQRIGLVAGYMKDEVRNLSPFSFMHQDDVRWVIVALRQMYDRSSDYGESYYRLLSRNGHFIYLHTRGFLEIDKATNKVHSFVCVNTLLDEEEGKRRVQEMKNKFSVIIKTKIPTTSVPDAPASQNPQQLERIVLYLIDNLQKRHGEQDDEMGGPGGAGGIGGLGPGSEHDELPTLSLVPPEAASVKNSISQSVTAINITAAKNLLYQLKSPVGSQRSSSGSVSDTSSMSPASSVDHSEDAAALRYTPSPSRCEMSGRPSVLQMHPAIGRSGGGDDTISVLKRLRASPTTVSEDPHIVSPPKRQVTAMRPLETHMQTLICASLHPVDATLPDDLLEDGDASFDGHSSFIIGPEPPSQLLVNIQPPQQRARNTSAADTACGTGLRPMAAGTTMTTTATTKTPSVIRQSKKL